MVKFSLVKRISGVLMLDTESFPSYQKQWCGCSPEEAKAKWKSVLALPHVHRKKVDGVKQVDEHTIGTEERTNAKTSNVDKMTTKRLCRPEAAPFKHGGHAIEVGDGFRHPAMDHTMWMFTALLLSLQYSGDTSVCFRKKLGLAAMSVEAEITFRVRFIPSGWKWAWALPFVQAGHFDRMNGHADSRDC